MPEGPDYTQNRAPARVCGRPVPWYFLAQRAPGGSPYFLSAKLDGSRVDVRSEVHRLLHELAITSVFLIWARESEKSFVTVTTRRPPPWA